MRTFEDKPAARERVPLLIGLMGPSGGGKTYSALRLATGIQRVSGGEIFVVDTEARRALHYADRFRFRHLAFAPPFGSLDYLAAIEHCAKKGAGVVIVDSMSHEHEGPGGLLETHEAEVERLIKAWRSTREKVQMTAWAKPKSDRVRMIQSILQIPVNFIFCFRAKEKLKIARGKDPEKLGFMPIAGPELVFEMTACALLMPNAGGVPTWAPEELGEKMMTKLPAQFRALLTGARGPLDEAAGEAMAKWAAGDDNPVNAEIVAAVNDARSLSELDDARGRATAAKDKLSKTEQAALRDLIVARRAAIEAEDKRRAESPPEDDGDPRYSTEDDHAEPQGDPREPGQEG
jgi:hypothetical protein